MIRDFAKNIHGLKSKQNENQINITQKDKQSWLLTSTNRSRFYKLQYYVYAFDLSVRSAYINDEYAFFNGSSLFISLPVLKNAPHYVEIAGHELLPNNTATGLAKTEYSENEIAPEQDWTYIATNYYELIDHPFILGHFTQHSFCVSGYRFHLVFSGKDVFDLKRFENDLRHIIEHHIAIFGDFPCQEYWFMTLVCNKGFGGLEHKNSTVLQFSRDELRVLGQKDNINKSYQQFLSLCSHELFHTWHVKRIQPEVMQSPDLSQEVYTPQLWIYEGFTSLYDDLSLARCQVITPEQYTQILSEALTRLYRNPGRLKQSVSESSFNAWTKFYKQDAGSINHIVSYYNKGAIVALCLDITIRQLSADKYSLDDLMRLLWENFGAKGVGTSDSVIEDVCHTYFNIDISRFIALACHSNEELPLSSLLEHIGLSLKFRASSGLNDKGGKSNTVCDKDFGASFGSQSDALYISSCVSQRAAANSGLQVGDKILALNEYECTKDNFFVLLNQAQLGDTLPLHVMRDGRLIELSFKIRSAVKDTCHIDIIDHDKFMHWLQVS